MEYVLDSDMIYSIIDLAVSVFLTFCLVIISFIRIKRNRCVLNRIFFCALLIQVATFLVQTCFMLFGNDDWSNDQLRTTAITSLMIIFFSTVLLMLSFFVISKYCDLKNEIENSNNGEK